MSARNNDQFAYAGEVLRSIFDRIVPAGSTAFSQLSSGWEKIAGREIAFHATPKDIVHGVLFLETDHPGWAQKVRLNQYHILKEINRKYPELEVRKLKISIMSEPSMSPQNRKETKNTAPPCGSRNEAVGRGSPKDVSEDNDFFELLKKMNERGGS